MSYPNWALLVVWFQLKTFHLALVHRLQGIGWSVLDCCWELIKIFKIIGSRVNSHSAFGFARP